MTEWVTCLFTLVGVALGTALEPVKNLFASRARTRAVRAERCAELIALATTCLHHESALAEDIEALLVIGAGADKLDKEQVQAALRAYRDARPELVKAAALIRLLGPSALAESADIVVAAEEHANDYVAMLIRHFIIPGENPFGRFKKAVNEFAILAGNYTR